MGVFVEGGDAAALVPLASYTRGSNRAQLLHSAAKLSVYRDVASGAAGGCFLNLLCLRRWRCFALGGCFFFFSFYLQTRGIDETKRSSRRGMKRCVVSAHFLLPASV